MKGQPPFKKLPRKAPTVHIAASQNQYSWCVSKSIGTAAYDIAPPVEQISHLRQVRTNKLEL